MSNQSRSGARGTCLIVEDSSFDQEKIKRIIERSFTNLDVVIAPTIERARAAVEMYKITVILLDNNLPDGNGASFAVELSEDAKHADIPVVIVSDWPTPFMFHKAEIAGVRHVVSKSDFGARFVHSALQQARGFTARIA
ncbi:MAG: response regulator [Roseobacter sp.]